MVRKPCYPLELAGTALLALLYGNPLEHPGDIYITALQLVNRDNLV